MLRLTLLSLLLPAIFIPVFANEKTPQLQIGDEIQLPVLNDQFGHQHSFNKSTEWLVFTHDMASGYIVKDTFDGFDNQKLADYKIQYYSDISTMPGLYARFIMLPKFKTLSYAMILGRETAELEPIPRIKGNVMVMKLLNGTVINLNYLNDIKGIKTILKLDDKK